MSEVTLVECNQERCHFIYDPHLEECCPGCGGPMFDDEIEDNIIGRPGRELTIGNIVFLNGNKDQDQEFTIEEYKVNNQGRFYQLECVPGWIPETSISEDSKMAASIGYYAMSCRCRVEIKRCKDIIAREEKALKSYTGILKKLNK